MAYESELAHLRLAKLQRYFTDSLTVHHLTLHSIDGGCSVSTFRQADLPKELLVSRLFNKGTLQAITFAQFGYATVEVNSGHFLNCIDSPSGALTLHCNSIGT